MKAFFVLFFININLLIASEYTEKIQPIFNNRCIACHSCFNGPCQLNLQNYSGFERGANKLNVYDGTRIQSVHPTRLGIDAKTVEEWRRLNFFTVNQSPKLDENIFYQMLKTNPILPKDLPSKSVEESVSCMDDAKIVKKVLNHNDDLKMPYGLMPLTEEERSTLGEWIKNGAIGPTEKVITPKELQADVVKWESFFNESNLKSKLVARYIYEHIFLAHIYFEQRPDLYFRLVRSTKKCSEGIDEIATRRPNDFPGTSNFYYCLKALDTTVVAKTHMPFLFSDKRLAKIKNIFYKEKWEVSGNLKLEELYSNKIAENPFLAFKDIPAKSRYEFLLENAYFVVSTFIKGPVCNGSNALNSIQEQFYVFFLKPGSGFLTSDNGQNAKDDSTNELLLMPGAFGSEVKLQDSWSLTKMLTEKREEYRKKKAEWLEKNKANGYGLADLWDGDKVNPNALLTVFRHDDNAVVTYGLKGDLSKTIFVLDYSLMERLVYNLVVNFDVFGNVGHQMLTRIYMDYIRMEAEENFLLFMPPSQRLPMRKEWYKGIFTDVKMSYLFPLLTKDLPTTMQYSDINNAKKEFVEKVLTDVMSKEVRGSDDRLNWKQLSVDENNLTSIEKELRAITSTKPKRRMRYPKFFPESSYLIVLEKNNKNQVYSVIRNREHENISWILGESLRLSSDEDTITILKDYHVFYPNYFFVVKEEEIGEFKNSILNMTNIQDFKNFTAKFGVSRTSDKFWAYYDLINKDFKEKHPVEFGYLDLTRYWMQ